MARDDKRRLRVDIQSGRSPEHGRLLGHGKLLGGKRRKRMEHRNKNLQSKNH